MMQSVSQSSQTVLLPDHYKIANPLVRQVQQSTCNNLIINRKSNCVRKKGRGTYLREESEKTA